MSPGSVDHARGDQGCSSPLLAWDTWRCSDLVPAPALLKQFSVQNQAWQGWSCSFPVGSSHIPLASPAAAWPQHRWLFRPWTLPFPKQSLAMCWQQPVPGERGWNLERFCCCWMSNSVSPGSSLIPSLGFLFGSKMLNFQWDLPFSHRKGRRAGIFDVSDSPFTFMERILFLVPFAWASQARVRPFPRCPDRFGMGWWDELLYWRQKPYYLLENMKYSCSISHTWFLSKPRELQPRTEGIEGLAHLFFLGKLKKNQRPAAEFGCRAVWAVVQTYLWAMFCIC